MGTFQFDPMFQQAFLRLMMIEDVFCIQVLRYCDRSYFTTEPLGWIYSMIEDHWKQYSTMCNDMVLRDRLRFAGAEKYVPYRNEVEQVIAHGTVKNSEYIKNQAQDFFRKNLFAQAHQESAQMFNDGRSVEAYDVMAKAQDAIRQIDFGAIDRQWFFEELQDRQRARHRRQLHTASFRTGLDELDMATRGGVKPGEVWAVLAYAKRCKTTWLVNQGFNAIRMTGAPVIHYVLEGHGHQISDKYETLFSGELYSSVQRGEISQQVVTQLHQEYYQARRRLVIRTLNDWDVNVLQIKAELEELKGYGFRPELMILDYIDLLRSRYRADSETKHQVEASRDFKRLVNQEHIAAWTAWQAQRPKENSNTRKHVLTSASVADAYAKVRIVDAYGSLNATDQEMAEGLMRVHWEGYRDSGDIHRTWLISNDLAHQKMVTEVIAAETEGDGDDD